MTIAPLATVCRDFNDSGGDPTVFHGLLDDSCLLICNILSIIGSIRSGLISISFDPSVKKDFFFAVSRPVVDVTLTR
jgi:hypothetical protein